MNGPNMIGFILYCIIAVTVVFFRYEYKVLANKPTECKNRKQAINRARWKLIISAAAFMIVVGLNIFYFNKM